MCLAFTCDFSHQSIYGLCLWVLVVTCLASWGGFHIFKYFRYSFMQLSSFVLCLIKWNLSIVLVSCPLPCLLQQNLTVPSSLCCHRIQSLIYLFSIQAFTNLPSIRKETLPVCKKLFSILIITRVRSPTSGNCNNSFLKRLDILHLVTQQQEVNQTMAVSALF